MVLLVVPGRSDKHSKLVFRGANHAGPSVRAGQLVANAQLSKAETQADAGIRKGNQEEFC